MKTDLVVAGYAFHEGKLLLILHKKTGLWLPVGGHIEENEVPDDALAREFMEEVGLKIRISNSIHVPKEGNIVRQLTVPFYVNVHNVGDHDHCCLFYICEILEGENIKINKNEVSNFRWFSRNELLSSEIEPDVRNIGLKAFEMFDFLKD